MSKIRGKHHTSPDPSLENVFFQYDPTLGEIRSIRGRTPGAAQNCNSFLWSPAVRALSVLIIRAYAYRFESQPISLSGEEGTLASSLDYSISKNPAWISDMFGYDADGISYAKKLLLRSNPERKRPGPVLISINPQVLKSNAIKIILNGKELLDQDECLSLAGNVEEQFNLQRGRPGEYRIKSVLKKTSLHIEDQKISAFRASINISSLVKTHIIRTESELIQDFKKCLRSRMIDRKFGFLGHMGVQAWAELCRCESYPYSREDFNIIKEAGPLVADMITDKCQLISVWPGTGQKEYNLFEALSNKRDVTLNFVDTSTRMLEYALTKHHFGREKTACYVADFMKPQILSTICNKVRRDNAPNVLTFIGHCLGAHPQAEMLQTVYSAMAPQDYVFLGVQVNEVTDVGGAKEIEHLVEQYENPNFTKLNLSNLSIAGINPSAGVVEIESRRDRFFPELWTIETYFCFTESHSIEFFGETMMFSSGERIMLNFYYQYTQSAIEKIILSQGFKIVKSFSRPSGATEFICQI